MPDGTQVHNASPRLPSERRNAGKSIEEVERANQQQSGAPAGVKKISPLSWVTKDALAAAIGYCAEEMKAVYESSPKKRNSVLEEDIFSPPQV